jgi:molybdopterin synthase catalytic subunit
MATQTGIHEKGTFSLSDAIGQMKSGNEFEKAGAIAVFIGVVRGETPDGDKVQKLSLEAYEEKANEVLVGICDDLKKKQGIVDVQIHHLLGDFAVGEDLVYVLIAGSHRQNVFPVLEKAVERYKKEAPIFKKELVVTEAGETKACWVTEKETE